MNVLLIHVSQATQSTLGPGKTGVSPASCSNSRPCTCSTTQEGRMNIYQYKVNKISLNKQTNSLQLLQMVRTSANLGLDRSKKKLLLILLHTQQRLVKRAFGQDQSLMEKLQLGETCCRSKSFVLSQNTSKYVTKYYK